MKVKLIRHAFVDDPDWEVIDKSVPVGTEYEVIGYERDMTVHNLETRKIRRVSCYFLIGNGGQGWLPTECFESIMESI